jgi:hypothetical protein
VIQYCVADLTRMIASPQFCPARAPVGLQFNTAIDAPQRLRIREASPFSLERHERLHHVDLGFFTVCNHSPSISVGDTGHGPAGFAVRTLTRSPHRGQRRDLSRTAIRP